jgi:hypothetical protein
VLLRLEIACYSAPSRLALDAYCSPRKSQFITFRGIDLFVVSDIFGVKLAELLGPLQNQTNRAINTSQFTPTEYNQRKQGNDHFLTQVLDGPGIVIIGDMDES